MSGGREDFESFVAARYDALLRTAYLLTGDHHDAEDLLQQALIKAVGAWGRMEQPEAYVRTILVRQNVSRWRRRRWREVHTAEPPELPPGSDDGALDRLALEGALSLLAPRQRAVIVLRYYEDLTEVQTASALGISVGTVKSQTRDALKRLREAMPELADVLVSP